MNDLSLWADRSQIPSCARLEPPGSFGSTKYWLSRSISFWTTFHVFKYIFIEYEAPNHRRQTLTFTLSFQIEASWQETHHICIGLRDLAYTFRACYIHAGEIETESCRPFEKYPRVQRCNRPKAPPSRSPLDESLSVTSLDA